MLEAQRLTSSQRNLRIAKVDVKISDQAFKAGDAVVLLLVSSTYPPSPHPPRRSNATRAGPSGLQPNPKVKATKNLEEFRLDRPVEAITFIVGMVKLVAGLRNLRPAPRSLGAIKHIQVGTEGCYLNDSWSHLTFDPTSDFLLHCLLCPILDGVVVQRAIGLLTGVVAAWKLHFDGYGKGVYEPPPLAGPPKDWDLIQVESDMRKAKEAQNGAKGQCC